MSPIADITQTTTSTVLRIHDHSIHVVDSRIAEKAMRRGNPVIAVDVRVTQAHEGEGEV